MISMDQKDPSWVEVRGLAAIEEAMLRRLLTDTNTSVGHRIRAIKRFLKSGRAQPSQVEEMEAELLELEPKAKVCWLQPLEGEPGAFRFLSGDLKLIVSSIKPYGRPIEFKNHLKYPEREHLWPLKEPLNLRPYQKQAADLLVEAKHANVALATGLGKSRTAVEVVRQFGVQTLIQVPSVHLMRQLAADFEKYLGKALVGMYGDGVKKTDRMITIATGQSLARLVPGTVHYNNLAKAKLYLVDESHTTPSATFQAVALGVAANAPYRIFLSATQTRGDGQLRLLGGLIGPEVMAIDVREGWERLGALAKPDVTAVKVIGGCHQKTFSNSTKEVELQHIKSRKLNALAGVWARKFANRGERVLILIDEYTQYNQVIVGCGEVPLAHTGAPSNTRVKQLLPKGQWKSDPRQLVAEFDEGKHPILIGTSAICTGVDIQTVTVIIYVRGGVSEVAIPQAFGRGTRKPEGKEFFRFLDFYPGDEEWAPTCVRHGEVRSDWYRRVAWKFREMEVRV